MVCTVCNDGPGDPATVTFPDTGTRVEVTLCAACLEAFSNDDACELLSPADSSAVQ